jgi:hypothetical protein
MILLPPESWDYGHAPLCLALKNDVSYSICFLEAVVRIRPVHICRGLTTAHVKGSVNVSYGVFPPVSSVNTSKAEVISYLLSIYFLCKLEVLFTLKAHDTTFLLLPLHLVTQ